MKKMVIKLCQKMHKISLLLCFFSFHDQAHSISVRKPTSRCSYFQQEVFTELKLLRV